MDCHISDMGQPDGFEGPGFSIKPLTIEFPKVEFPKVELTLEPLELPTELPSPSKGFGREFAVNVDHPSNESEISATCRPVPMPENARRAVERIQELREEIRALEEQAKRLR